MLRITRLSDYAIVVLGEAARSIPDAFTARAAAEQTGLPLPAVKKILKALGRVGLVESQRGTAGGYRLGRPATQIALADIIDAIEGPFALTNCGQNPSDTEAPCEYVGHCGVHSNWSRVNGIVRRALASVTLADMIGPGERELVSLRLRRGSSVDKRLERRTTPAANGDKSATGKRASRPRDGWIQQ